MRLPWIRAGRAFVPAVSLIALAACGRKADPPPPAAAPASAPTSAAAPASELAQPDDRAHVALRYQDYHRQATIEWPPGFPPEGRALRPEGDHKLVACGLERQMALTRPAPGRRKLMVRFVSRSEVGSLPTLLGPHLAALGFESADPGLRAPLTHPKLGRLTVAITARDDEAARVELVLEGPDAQDPLEDPLRWLHTAQDWLVDAEARVVGYEYGHFHAVRFAGATTDLQRVAVQVRLATPEAAEALRLRLTDRVEQAGFRFEAKDSGLFRGPDGGMFVVKAAEDPHEVIIHHQQRWRR